MPKCKCSDCGALVDRWLGMVCIPCHDRAAVARALDGATLLVPMAGPIRQHAEVTAAVGRAVAP